MEKMEKMYQVFAGEPGEYIGHFCGASETLRGAQWLAERARRAYDSGWSLIVNDETGERYEEGPHAALAACGNGPHHEEEKRMFTLTKGSFEELFDPNAELHKKPLESIEDACEVAEGLILQFPEDFVGTSTAQLARKLMKWFSVEAMNSCNCMYCSRRRGGDNKR